MSSSPLSSYADGDLQQQQERNNQLILVFIFFVLKSALVFSSFCQIYFSSLFLGFGSASFYRSVCYVFLLLLRFRWRRSRGLERQWLVVGRFCGGGGVVDDLFSWW